MYRNLKEQTVSSFGLELFEKWDSTYAFLSVCIDPVNLVVDDLWGRNPNRSDNYGTFGLFMMIPPLYVKPATDYENNTDDCNSIRDSE
ncbi:MAG: hypothetical protein Ct9H300mP13_8110 [Gammaproteobacteria bacterium]|nr:MAG: hypothetical protein Ct9H300mP13_8110 [Gammaproteobacteria bacterium]